MQRRIFTLLTAATLLSACQSGHEGYTLQCPRSSIVYDLSKQTQIDPKSNKVSSVVHIDQISPICKMDEKSKSFILSMRPSFTAGRTVKGKSKTLNTKYFIAVADLNGQIIDKRLYDLPIYFDSDSRKEQITLEDHFEYKFKRKQDLQDKQFFIGLQLDAEQVRTNLARNKR